MSTTTKPSNRLALEWKLIIKEAFKKAGIVYEDKLTGKILVNWNEGAITSYEKTVRIK